MKQTVQWPAVQRVMRLRLAAAAVVTIGVLNFAGAARADFFTPVNRRWCALTAVGFNDCSFDTFAQCLATLSGVGGTCVENLQAPQYDEPPPPRKRRSKRQ